MDGEGRKQSPERVTVLCGRPGSSNFPALQQPVLAIEHHSQPAVTVGIQTQLEF